MSEVKVIKAGRKLRCKHFTGIAADACAAGVAYASVGKDHEPIRYQNGSFGPVYTVTRSLPCIAERNLGGATCEKCDLPSAEEFAAEEAEMNARIERMGKARAAIVAHLGGPWKKGVTGARGVIDCPACGKPGALHYSRAGVNGHVHATCATAGCCSWME
jgi:hypothetical protein